MSTRCGCADEGDDIVFGPVHWCTADASVRGRHADPFSPVPVIPERLYERVLSEDELQ